MVDRATTTFQVGADKFPVSIYTPSGVTGKLPAVVLLHGTDGLEGESGTEIPKLAEQIADAGFVVFVPEYFGSEPAGLPLEAVYVRRIQSVGSIRAARHRGSGSRTLGPARRSQRPRPSRFIAWRRARPAICGWRRRWHR